MPKRPYEWHVESHGCYKFNNADLALGPRNTTAHLPLFLHLRTTNFPGPDSIILNRNVKPPSISVENAVEDLPSLQPPNVQIPPLRENTAGAVSMS